jgi:membrane-associated phospholipid phosphatase
VDAEAVELRHDLRVDIPVTAGLAAVTIGFRLVRDDLEPSHCRICDGDRTGDGKVNAVDDWFRTALRRNDIGPANYTSYVLAFGAAPLGAIGFTILSAVDDGRSKNILVDLLVVAEGGFSAMMTTQVLEAVTLRARPYVHAMSDDDERNAEIAKTGAFHSFPAGHVVEAFGVAAAAGTVASMRGYRLAPLVWTAGILFGVGTAYTRMAADRHYFTDVLAGAGIGTAVGAGIPLLFHAPVSPLGEHARFMTAPVAGGQIVGIGGTF